MKMTRPYILIEVFMKDNPDNWFSAGYITEKLKIKTRVVHNILHNLAELGWVKRRINNRIYEYKLNEANIYSWAGYHYYYKNFIKNKK